MSAFHKIIIKKSMLCICFSINFAFATQYQITDLTPSGYLDSYANGIGDGIQVGVAVNNQGSGIAGAWNGSASSFTPFNQPTNFDGVDALAAYGTQQAGYGYPNIQTTGLTIIHALLWNGPSSNATDMNPLNFYSTEILAMDGSQQVGWSYIESAQGRRRAMVWSGTAASAVDLHLSNYNNTEAWGVGGGQQVGDSYDSPHTNLHALMWTGSASSVVDLTPLGAHGAAYAADGIHQGGVINSHAAYWSGTKASYQDFNPIGYSSSAIFQMLPGVQVGSATSIATGQTHAAIWNGSLGSFQDINPAGYNYSVISQIAPNGWMIGTANDGNHYHALIWKPVPEPGTLATLVTGLLTLGARFRKRK